MTIMASDENNWKLEFYKNGYPKEVIVIEDSPTPPRTPLIQEPSYSTSTSTIAQTPTTNYMNLPPAASTRSKRALRDQEEYRAAHQQRQQLLQLRQQQQQQQRKRRQRQLPSSPVATPAVTKRRRKGTSAIQGQTVNSKTVVRIPPNNIATGDAAPTKSSPIDDKNGHVIFRQNEFLTRRYRMVRILGQGTFGKVIECYDLIKRRRCAIKVIRSIQKYRDASLIEMRVLETLKKHDPLNYFKCIHLNEWFDHEHHICMVFELLGPSVFDFLKANHFKPFSLGHIQQFAKQIFASVAFLHRLKLVHTDLKPENVLLLNTKTIQGKSSAKSTRMALQSTEIRLIDFGSATFEQEYHSSVVSTRHYRAPEIILNTGWSYPCDIWSIGCMLVEFFTGDALFQTHDNLEHLAMMEVVIGEIPNKMICKSQQNRQAFFEKSKLLYPTPKTSKQSINYVNSLHTLKEIVPPDVSEGNAHFLDLLNKIFIYDPQSRITATDALRHPFFQCKF